MNVAQIITEKRDARALSSSQIEGLISGYTKGNVPDYQMSAFAMAVYFQGMTLDETTCLTQAMINSGEVMEWNSPPPVVDKHSTGGIGDKASIVLAPLLACCGLQVPMISGRGLGATGGTLDKLESIPGYRTELSADEFRSIVSWNQCSIASATKSLAPADKKLYALRDVTGTVPSIPLITASILSKKLAEGIDSLVLDVKWGSGAFMKSQNQARELASTLVKVGNQLGVTTSALITDMNQPLGRMIGNAVEIDECVQTLKGNGPDDVLELTCALGAQLLTTTGICQRLDQAEQLLQSKIQSGEGLERLREMVRSHGGDLDQPRQVANEHQIQSDQEGVVTRIEADRLGLAVIEMGGGRKKMGDEIDHSTGIEMLVRLGDQVKKGQSIARVFCNDSHSKYAIELVGASIAINPQLESIPELILDTIDYHQ